MPKIGPDVRAARRGQFVSAARAPAAETGFRTPTIDDVCARAGLSKGAFHVHFSSKQELLHHADDPAGFRWENVAKVVDILLDHLRVNTRVLGHLSQSR